MESSPLDYVAQACMDLTEALSATSNAAEEETLITNHIKKVWSAVNPIEDFKKNLEWVNVSEPISLSEHCSDKIVVLDFWTYCCINCYHVLQDLARLEKLHSVESGLVVIGVHSAKFDNEKETPNILAAVQRYEIHHPVVNDADNTYWKTLGINCWPTFLILGPGNKPLFVLVGEGHGEELVTYVGAAMRYFSGRLADTAIPVALNNHLDVNEGVLLFPGKVSLNPFYRGRAEEPFLAISDTGHHRVVLTDCSGLILRIIGGPHPGFKDAKVSEARFRSPQGLCWLSSSVLAVCDTGNHALRAIHLDEGTVDTLAGTGKQASFGDMGGKCLGLQPLSSPWDVVLYSTPDMDMTVRAPQHAHNTDTADGKAEKEKADKKDEKRRVLLIAAAGSHQIWALFLDNTIWWKYKAYSEGTCVCIAGTGAESARNSAYPNTATFAQPSGLALRTGSSPELFVADSESSSIRILALSVGQVTTLCGGDRNPLNLFAYGDADGIGIDAKLQHPLGVAYCEANKTLYVADTYNHKVKKLDVGLQKNLFAYGDADGIGIDAKLQHTLGVAYCEANKTYNHKVTTMYPHVIETTEPAKFNEPSGLAVTPDGKYLYIADSNNHCIKVLNIAKNLCHEFKVRLPDPKFTEPENLILYKNDLFVNRKCGNLIIYFNVSLDADTKNVKFTPGAPQNWNVCVRDDNNKDVTLEDFEFISSSPKGNKLPGRVELKLKQRTDKTHYRLYLSFQTALCDAAVCFSHSFTIRSTILVRESVKMVESYKITCKVNPVNRIDNKNETAKT